MKQLLFLILSLGVVLNVGKTMAQGCVAIRGNAGCGGVGNSLNLNKGEFNPRLGYRYFKSFRHFRGDVEETNRIEEGTQVINHSHFVDLSLSYGITNRFYAAFILPISINNRSSMYEHGGNPPNGLGERHETNSGGIGDIRIGFGYWLFNPDDHDYNYAVGLGIKLPTGNYNTTDLFYNQGPNKDLNIMAVVDQSIQLGDGGTGLTFDFQGYHPLSQHFGISSNLYYLFNFTETNGVLTRSGNSEFSCPDQYAARVGGIYNSKLGLNGYLGGRIEGVPATDIFGGSAGYRRPGYVVAFEPGIGYIKNNLSFFLSMPVSLYRNRTQSYEDKIKTETTGIYAHGDAAFADYVVNFEFSYRFGGKKIKVTH